MFSRRVPGRLDPTPLAQAVRARREAAAPFIDLTDANPTRLGFVYPAGLFESLADSSGGEYDPQPLGLFEARQAVASDYARRGVPVAPSRVALTTSTSESYSVLFKLLCDPGDSVLVPQPSYPLFEYLTALDGVEGRPYRLASEGGWAFDMSTVRESIDERTRAVLVVSPNNPTGAQSLAELCRDRAIALIGDEVFADYELVPAAGAARSVLEQNETLTFGLGGLSKSAGLPQLKLGWIAVSGPEAVAAEALERLEVVCDAYLSVATPVQRAAAALLSQGAAVRRQIADRVLLNYRCLVELVADYPACRVPPIEGGWTAVIRAPAVMPDDTRALELLHREGVLVHPGYLFDFEQEGHFVVSLLCRPEEFRTGVRRVLNALEARG
jgi:alanine-synthesizing transaminase